MATNSDVIFCESCDSDIQQNLFKLGMSNIWPMGHMWPWTASNWTPQDNIYKKEVYYLYTLPILYILYAA